MCHYCILSCFCNSWTNHLPFTRATCVRPHARLQHSFSLNRSTILQMPLPTSTWAILLQTNAEEAHISEQCASANTLGGGPDLAQGGRSAHVGNPLSPPLCRTSVPIVLYHRGGGPIKVCVCVLHCARKHIASTTCHSGMDEKGNDKVVRWDRLPLCRGTLSSPPLTTTTLCANQTQTASDLRGTRESSPHSLSRAYKSIRTRGSFHSRIPFHHVRRHHHHLYACHLTAL